MGDRVGCFPPSTTSELVRRDGSGVRLPFPSPEADAEKPCGALGYDPALTRAAYEEAPCCPWSSHPPTAITSLLASPTNTHTRILPVLAIALLEFKT